MYSTTLYIYIYSQQQDHQDVAKNYKSRIEEERKRNKGVFNFLLDSSSLGGLEGNCFIGLWKLQKDKNKS